MVRPYWGEEVERRSEACVTWAVASGNEGAGGSEGVGRLLG
jgi:hypothetical protein